MKIKTHLAIPEDLVAEVDRIAGKRRRSLFIAEATREKLAKERFLSVLEETSGSWSDKNHPELKSAKAVESYVREKRQSYGKRQRRRSMSKFLLDTDVIIWHLRGRKEVTRVLTELQAFGVPSCSALSILEVQVGVRRGEEAKTDLFLGSLTVFDVTKKIADQAALAVREQKARGVTIDLPDAVIAATCMVHGLTLVTYNKKHYPFRTLDFHPVPGLL